MKQLNESVMTTPPNVGSIISNGQPASLIQLGHSREDCLEYLAAQGISSTSFAHWLIVPELQLLLAFKQQRCIAIEQLAIGRGNLAPC